MGLEQLVIDNITENSSNAPLALDDRDNGVELKSMDFPELDYDGIYAGSVDTEGSAPVWMKPNNFEATVVVKVKEPTTAAETNLRTNPSGELTDKFDADGTDFVVERFPGNSSVPAFSGDYRDRHSFDGSSSASDMGTIAITFSSAGQYVVSMYVWIPSNWTGGTLRLDAGSYAGATGETQIGASLALRDQWQRIYTYVTVVSGDLSGNFVLKHDDATPPSSAGTGVAYSDAVQSETGSVPTPYFDGDTAGCAWTGTRYASTSTRPASGGSRFQAILRDLQAACSRLTRERNGTIRRRLASGDTITFDVTKATLQIPTDWFFVFKQYAEVPIKFECRPYGRGAAVTGSDHTKTTTSKALIFTEDIGGQVEALGKLVVDEDEGADQFFLAWGMQSRYYNAGTTSSLLLEAEDLTPQGGAVTGARTGDSSLSHVRQGTLTPTYQSMLSTAFAAGGVHQQHIGEYRVWGRFWRPTTNAGTVSLALEWAEGDFRKRTTNDPVVYDVDDREGDFTLANLGTVQLSEVAQGTQRWEGRVIAKSSTTGDDLECDCLMLFPTDGYGEIRAVTQFENPTSYSARDEFGQAVSGGSDPLTGLTAPVGGVWAGAGDSDDFVVEDTGHTAQRTAGSDASTNIQDGRLAISGVAGFAAQLVQVDFKLNATAQPKQGVVARYTDISNFLAAIVLSNDSRPSSVAIYKRVAGALSTIAGSTINDAGAVGPPVTANVWTTIRLLVDASGRYALWAFPTGGGTGAPVFQGQDADLATGGALASGKPGFVDNYSGSGTLTRNYDNWLAAVPTADAAIFANQSLELRHDRVIREDSGGDYWNTPSDVRGNYLKIPPAGREGRTARMIVVTSRNDPDTGPDPATSDDFSARLTTTPRYLTVPDP